MHVVLLTTDANYQSKGRAAAYSAQIAVDYPEYGLLDYPNVEELKAMLQSKNVLPIFAVTSGQVATYEALVAQLGFGSVTVLGSSSDNLVEVVDEAMSGACSSVYLQPMVDPENRVAVSPNSVMGEPGMTYDFTVSVDTTGLTEEYHVVLGAADGSTIDLVVMPPGETVETGPDGHTTCPEPTVEPTAMPTGSPTEEPTSEPT